VTLVSRCQNHTNATQIRLIFVVTRKDTFSPSVRTDSATVVAPF